MNTEEKERATSLLNEVKEITETLEKILEEGYDCYDPFNKDGKNHARNRMILMDNLASFAVSVDDLIGSKDISEEVIKELFCQKQNEIE